MRQIAELQPLVEASGESSGQDKIGTKKEAFSLVKWLGLSGID